ncbi:unnamed protein product [Microthlaspi erraticum]|uniref:F-box domain-containing protein n=1 Tax=Microthlaspi erraticum TaxID=1685480 RepID=A0A6D2LEL5_9BRAS|nr:unnamed protein product [Microthlaspi erraticum]CAA7059657.1 unnamed protein product [Microthlaspi erraticum]CAA7059658.1 unnamed protein product [Microthlaspi erraticum]
MDWTSFPEDVVEEILSWVPAKSVAQWRSTSKPWNALLKSRIFAQKHSANAPKEKSLVITLLDSRVCLVNFKFRGIHANEVVPSVEVAYTFNLTHGLSDTSQVGIINIFHCDGLLLCTTIDNKLVVWNPCSGDTKWIKPRDSYKTSDYYALGYDDKSSRKQYKILRVGRQDMLPIKNEYEIYDLASDSWRVLGVATDWFLASHRRGISVKGITYWVATRRLKVNFLLSFDFSTERFQSRPLPHPFPYSNASLSVVGEEQLCLVGADRQYCMKGIYVRTEFQVWVSTSTGWSKSLEVKGHNDNKLSDGMVGFWAYEQNQVVMSVSSTNHIHHIVIENKHIQVDNLGGDSTCIPSCSVLLNFVPTLAQVSNKVNYLPGGRKRKAPCT